jgi:hypothetical protein
MACYRVRAVEATPPLSQSCRIEILLSRPNVNLRWSFADSLLLMLSTLPA